MSDNLYHKPSGCHARGPGRKERVWPPSNGSVNAMDQPPSPSRIRRSAPHAGTSAGRHRALAASVTFLLLLPSFAMPAEAAEPAPLATVDYPLGSWMMFQGGPSHRGQAQTAVPPNGRVVWSHFNQSVDKPEGGAVVQNGTAYVPLGKDLTALNLTNGSKLWSYSASGPIRTTPALWNDTVFFGTDVGFEAPNFFAVNATSGQLKWSTNESSALGTLQFVKTSPVVADDIVYHGSYTYHFYARHVSNGSIVWSANLSSEVHASPALVGGLVLVATQGIHDIQFNNWVVVPQLFAFDALTGTEVWNRTIPDGHLYASPVVEGGVAYLATGGFRYSITYDSGYVLAVNVSDGALLWKSGDIGRSIATPAISDRTLYVGTAGDIGGPLTGSAARVRALDLDANGSVRWSVAVGVQEAIESPPVVVLDANGSAAYVVASGMDGTVGMWLASGLSTPLWTHRPPNGGGIVSPVAVVSELVLVARLDGRISAYGARPDLAVNWTDIQLTDPTPHVGQPVEVQVTVRNLGDKQGSANLTVSLNSTGTPIPLFEQRIDKLSFQGTGSVVLSQLVSFSPEGNVTIEAKLTNPTPTDGDLSNNQASANFTVLPAFSGWGARFADGANSNYFESPTPENGLPQFEDSYGLQGTGMLAIDGAVVFSVGEVIWSVYATNASAVRWSQAPSTAHVVGTLALSSSVLLAVTDDSMAWFLDPDDGALLGSVGLPAPPSASPVPLDGGFLVPCTDRLVWISAANQTVELVYQPVTVPPAARPALPLVPAVGAGHAFIISSVGELHAFDVATGLEAPGFPVALRAPTSLPPVVGLSHVFAVNGSMNISAFPLSPLSGVPEQEFTLDAPVSGPLAHAYGWLFVATGTSNLSVISPGSGVILRNVSLPNGTATRGVLAVANNTVFLGNRTLHAVSVKDGETLWTHALLGRGGVVGPAAIAGGLLHVQTASGALATFGAIPGLSPVANISSPPDGGTVRVGDVITFSADGSYDPEGTSLTYLWQYGDGESSTGSTTTHSYAFASAQFQVFLTVQDEQGLAATQEIRLQSIENAPPSLGIRVDEVSPDPLAGPHLDDTVWTFTVYYTDPNDDPPAFVRLFLTNETDPLREMVPRDPGDANYSGSVAYVWSGTLSSAVHYWNFSTSDGLAGFSTVTQSLAVRVFHFESDVAIPISYRALYVGLGNSTPYISRTTPPGPPGLGALDRFDFKLPSGATDLIFLNLTMDYNLTDANLDDYFQETIGLFWYDQDSLQWTNVTTGISTAEHTVSGNVSRDGIFGVFGTLRVQPLPPVPLISVVNDRTVFFVGEAVDLSARLSRNPNTNNTTQDLTFRWDFADGTSETGESVVHEFSEPGIYNITLNVTNSFGQWALFTVQISVRTEESTSTFLAIAALFVGALMLLFLLTPVWRRRGRSQAEIERREEQIRQAREKTRPRSPRPGRGPGGKKGTGGLAKDEQQVVDELDEEFEQQVRERQK